MNLSVAGMSWFSNIYRKFESVCEDVDEVMNNVQPTLTTFFSYGDCN